MNCYAVFQESKQLRVYSYSILEENDWMRARDLAFEFSGRMHDSGYPCSVELFHMCDVGRIVYTTGEQA